MSSEVSSILLLFIYFYYYLFIFGGNLQFCVTCEAMKRTKQLLPKKFESGQGRGWVGVEEMNVD